MSSGPVVETLQAVFLAAGQRHPYPMAGDYLRVHTSTVSNCSIRVHFHRGGWVDLRPGDAFHLVPGWVGFDLEERTGGAQTVTFTVGSGVEMDDNTRSISGTVSVAPATHAHATVADQSAPTGATTTILAADTSRRSAMIRSATTNGGTCRIGNGATAAQGLEIRPGEVVVIEGSSSIEVRNDTGAACVFEIITEAI